MSTAIHLLHLWTFVTSYRVNFTLLLLHVDEIWVWSTSRVKLTKGNRMAQRKFCSTAIVMTTDPKQVGQKLHPSVRDGWPDRTT